MTLDIIEPVKTILEEINAITGKSVKLIEKDNLGVFATVKMARRSMPNHLLFYRKEHDDSINHLISHECGHILRMFGVPEEKRLVPAMSNNTGAIAKDLENDLKRLSSIIPKMRFLEMVKIWKNGLVLQLTNLPPDIMIEKWIYDGYHELRPYQMRSIEKQKDLALGVLSNKIQKITPSKIYIATNTMNYTFFKILGDHFKVDLAKPYNPTPYKKRGKQLLTLTRKDYANNYGGDITMINRWAEFFGLSGWFEWVNFEDVPAGYTDSV